MIKCRKKELKYNIFDNDDIKRYIFSFLEHPKYRENIIDEYLTKLAMEQENVLTNFGLDKSYHKKWIYNNLNNSRLTYLLSKKMVFTYKCPFANIRTKTCFRNYETGNKSNDDKYKIIKSFIIEKRYEKDFLKDLIIVYLEIGNVNIYRFFKRDDILINMKKTIFISEDDIITKTYKSLLHKICFTMIAIAYFLLNVYRFSKFSVLYDYNFYYSSDFNCLVFYSSLLFGWLFSGYYNYINSRNKIHRINL